MKEGLLPFGPGAWVFIALYLCSLLLVGWWGYRARREDSMKDFYLAGGGFGFIVLVLTLYASTAATLSSPSPARPTGSATPGR